MIDRREPDAWKDLQERKLLRDDEYRKGKIGEATYLLSLKMLGYLPREAQTELSLLKMEKQ